MNNINTFIVSGRLTRDFGSGKYDWSEHDGFVVGTMSIACNKRVKKGDEWTDGVDYLEITVFGKTAEALKPYMTKGREVVIEGRIKQDTWKDSEGKNKSKLTLVARTIQLCGKSDKAESSQAPAIAQDGASKAFDEGIDTDINFGEGVIEEDTPF